MQNTKRPEYSECLYQHKTQDFYKFKSLHLLPLYIRCTLVTMCCGTHLSPLSVTHALCIENANCEKAK